MPQLDFFIYVYQYGLLSLSFFLLYDLMLNFWLPGFLNGLFVWQKLFMKFKSVSVLNSATKLPQLFLSSYRLFRMFFGF